MTTPMMEFDDFETRRKQLDDDFEALVSQRNSPVKPGNGIYARWQNPVLSRHHAPLHWRYDFDPQRNPYLMERIGVNSTFNAGALKLDDQYHMMVRVEGADRKSFFAVASSLSGVDCFRFRDQPVQMPETDERDTSVYDMRLTLHEDDWIYGLFCVERPDPAVLAERVEVVRVRGLQLERRLHGPSAGPLLAGGVEDLLLAGIEGVALGAHFQMEILAERRLRLERVAAATLDLDLVVLGMDPLAHRRRPRKASGETGIIRERRGPRNGATRGPRPWRAPPHRQLHPRQA